MTGYDPAADPVHGSGWNSAARWGGWSWNEPSRGEHFRRCSFCGSIHPEDLAAETAWRAEWADRKHGWPHKFYVNIPNRDLGALYCISSCHEAREGPYAPGGEHYQPVQERSPGFDWVARADLTPDQLAILQRDGMGTGDDHADFFGFGTRDSHSGKFYTIHLADPVISQDVKDAVQRVSGLRFTWLDDGRVRWEPWPQDTSA